MHNSDYRNQINNRGTGIGEGTGVAHTPTYTPQLSTLRPYVDLILFSPLIVI